MKKLTRRSFTASGILAAIASGFASLTGCDLDLGSCSNPHVYGPPPEYEEDQNEIMGVYGPPEYFGLEPDEGDEYDPEENELVDVYGPPEYFGIEVEEEPEEGAFVVEDNMPVLLYGPPAFFRTRAKDESEDDA